MVRSTWKANWEKEQRSASACLQHEVVMTNRKVLLVEDEKSLLNLFAEKIRKQGYEVLTAENGAEAWKIFQRAHFLVVVTDLRMPIKDGMEVLQDIKRSSPSTRVIIMTGFGNHDK